MNTNEKLTALRFEMQKRQIDAYFIPTADYHESEYVGPHFKARAFMSGFTGSQGTLVVTLNESALWVDGRYFIQAEHQIEGSEITLMKMGTPNTPTIVEYLAQKLVPNAMLGFDGKVVNTAFMKQLQPLQLQYAMEEDLVDLIWSEREALPCSKGWNVPLEVCGKSVAEKVALVREQLALHDCDAHLITSLDDIAYLLNLRGNDIPHFPVLLAYVLMLKDETILYMNEASLDEDVKASLQANGITIAPYNQIYEDIKHVSYQKLWFDETVVNYALGSQIPTEKAYNAFNPTQLMKACKNEAELNSTRQAHIQDGAAMVKFLYWLKNNVASGTLNEVNIADFLANKRYELGAYDLSFDTIAAYLDHGAMMHYSATKESAYTLKEEGFLLVDSGGQYPNGTTDITRTIVLGPISDKMKLHFTTALKSHIRLSKAIFLEGCSGMNLDILARGPLWDLGLDYRCGTGHGVGHLLNVHEGPNGFRWKVVPERKDSAPLQVGMIQSNEPGVYLEGEYGIRHENEMIVIEKEVNEYGRFLCFETITFVPFDLAGIDASLLSADEIQWLNDYHQETYTKLCPYLSAEEQAWLKEATQAI